MPLHPISDGFAAYSSAAGMHPIGTGVPFKPAADGPPAGRGLIGGGNDGPTNVIDYITISSEGNALDFGDLSIARWLVAGLASSTRGIFGGGATATSTDRIDYVTIDSLGDATDFGDLAAETHSVGGLSSETRGVFFNGFV